MAATLQKGLEAATKYVEDNKKTVGLVAGGTAVGLVAYLAYKKAMNAVPASGPYPTSTLPAGCYDALIVGAGVCGLAPAASGVRCMPHTSCGQDANYFSFLHDQVGRDDGLGVSTCPPLCFGVGN